AAPANGSVLAIGLDLLLGLRDRGAGCVPNVWTGALPAPAASSRRTGRCPSAGASGARRAIATGAARSPTWVDARDRGWLMRGAGGAAVVRVRRRGRGAASANRSVRRTPRRGVTS